MNKAKKAFVFDLDGTLFETAAREIVDYEDPAETRYVEFADPALLLDKSKPLPLVDLARKVQEEGHAVYVLTARCSIIGPAIEQLLGRYGIKPLFIFTVGDRGLQIPLYKSEVLYAISQTHDATYFFDDDEDNLAAAPPQIRTEKA